jgi:hypothetical protein
MPSSSALIIGFQPEGHLRLGLLTSYVCMYIHVEANYRPSNEVSTPTSLAVLETQSYVAPSIPPANHKNPPPI